MATSEKKCSENMMEVITRGSFEHRDVHSRPLTSHSVNSVSQLTLECLPPEAPHFTLIGMRTNNTSICKDELTDTDISRGEGEKEEEEEWIHGRSSQAKDKLCIADTDHLYERVSKLSHDVQNKLAESSVSHGEGDEFENPRSFSADPRIDIQNRDSMGGSKSVTSHNSPPPSVASNEPDPSSRCSPCSEQSAGQFADPKTRKAYEKMLKLDERLASLSKREREVKKQRRLLEEQMEKAGAAQPCSGDLVLVDNDGFRSVSPVFRTQPDETVSVKQRLGGPIFDDSRIESTEDAQSASATPQEPSFEAEDKPGRKRKQRDAEEDGEIMGTNFIKRNIELVADAGALVMMTQAEKQRLQELMEDETKVTEMDVGDYADNKALCAYHNLNTAFALSENDVERMKELDSQLQAILPFKHWDSIYSPADWTVLPSPSQHTTTTTTTTPTAVPTAIGTTCGCQDGGAVTMTGSTSGSQDGGELEAWDDGAVPGDKVVSYEGASEDVKDKEQCGSTGGSDGGEIESRELVEGNMEGDSTVSDMELLCHMHVSHDEREQLKVIDEKLRLLHEESAQIPTLDDQVLHHLLTQCMTEQRENLPAAADYSPTDTEK